MPALSLTCAHAADVQVELARHLLRLWLLSSRCSERYHDTILIIISNPSSSRYHHEAEKAAVLH